MTVHLAVLPPDPEMPSLAVRVPRPELGPWRAGNTGIEGVWSFESGAPGPHLLLTALVHGNEVAGAALLLRYLEEGLRPATGRLTLAFANLAAFDRFDPEDPTASRFLDEDMNRVWAPATLDGPRRSAELERARALLPVLRQADVLLDLHSMLWPSDPLMIAGPGEAARALGVALGSPGVVVADEGHAGGLRLIDHPHFAEGPRALLVEAGPHWEAETAAQMALTAGRLMRCLGMLGPAPAPGEWQAGRLARVTRTVTAQSSGFVFLRGYRGGEVVPRRNTLLALDGEAELRTPHDDCLLVMPSPRVLRGHTAVRLARFVD